MPAMSARRPLIALVAMVSLFIAGLAEARTEVYGAAPLVRLASNRPAVLVVINERGPFLFVVDTATTNTVLTPALQRRLRIPPLPGPAVDVVSAAGSVRSHYYRVAEIALAGVIVEGGRAVMMDLPEEEGVMGVLGAEFLSNFKVDLDMPAKRMALYPDRAAVLAPNHFRVQGRLTEHGIIVVPARVENTNVWAAFDSGGRRTIANSWLAGATGHYDSAKLRNYESYVRDAASRRYTGVSEDFTRIQVGPAIWSNRDVLISDIKVFEQIGHGTKPIMFIGMDLMANRRVIIDYADASLWLSR
ncbi:MAG: retropepsin-like aspartic protease [Alphaproteobacteria bacterium]|nr:retropepsin-like aspartic protease [Alphaproteobacteria bacterium]